MRENPTLGIYGDFDLKFEKENSKAIPKTRFAESARIIMNRTIK